MFVDFSFVGMWLRCVGIDGFLYFGTIVWVECVEVSANVLLVLILFDFYAGLLLISLRFVGSVKKC